MNGANDKDSTPYEPQISSYDYDAPLDEAGNPTPKFMKFREVIQKYLPVGQVLPPVPQSKPAISIENIQLTQAASIFNVLPTPVTNSRPLTFEDLHQPYGFVLYRTFLTGGRSGILKINELRDYGIVFVNGQRIGVLDRRFRQDSLYLDLPKGKIRLDILVENLGRVNFGPNLLKNKKGITQKVTFQRQELTGWQMFSLPFDQVNTLSFSQTSSVSNGPVIRKGTFELKTIGDTYLDMSQWGKGSVWVNGHHLGRYWQTGPQQTLYLPLEWLKKGKNEVVVLELLKGEQQQLKSIEKPILDHLNP
jgi:beta-galactosidase